MSGPRENPGVLADEARTSLADAVVAMRQCLDAMRQRGDGQSGSARAVSIAITHAETSELWLGCAMTGGEV